MLVDKTAPETLRALVEGLLESQDGMAQLLAAYDPWAPQAYEILREAARGDASFAPAADGLLEAMCEFHHRTAPGLVRQLVDEAAPCLPLDVVQ